MRKKLLKSEKKLLKYEKTPNVLSQDNILDNDPFPNYKINNDPFRKTMKQIRKSDKKIKSSDKKITDRYNTILTDNVPTETKTETKISKKRCFIE